MAWTATNPVSVGNPTKKKDYDKLWDNVDYIKTSVMSSGTVLLFAQNAPPTGWTRKTGWNPGAGYANIVYSSGQCTTGGAKAATSDIALTQAAHNHIWYSSGGGGDGAHGTYNSAGTLIQLPTTNIATANQISVSRNASTNLRGDCYTNNATPTISKSTAFKYISVIAATKDKYVP